MSEKEKNDIRNLAKMAKNRLKNGFWEDYSEKVKKQVVILKEEGENTSDVIRFYKEKASKTISEVSKDSESFYKKVKEILDTYGEVSDMIGRLCDDDYLKTLSFSQKEKYIFELASKYRECKERYDREKRFGFNEGTEENTCAI